MDITDTRHLWSPFAGPLADADSVELKVLLPADRAVVTRLAGDRAVARSRRLYLLDSDGAALARAGLVLRVRRRAGGRDDVVVKARHDDPEALLRGGDGEGGPDWLELDALPGATVWTSEVRRRVATERVSACLAGSVPLRELFDDDQRAFLGAVVADRRDRLPADLADGVDLDTLVVHGPLVVERTPVPADRFPDGARLERCVYPCGSRLLELSARCAPDRADDVAAAISAFLGAHGVGAATSQRTKTEVWADLIRRPERPAR